MYLLHYVLTLYDETRKMSVVIGGFVKVWKFKICEVSMFGTFDREIEIKARTETSAEKKLWAMCGNRSWTITAINGVATREYAE